MRKEATRLAGAPAALRAALLTLLGWGVCTPGVAQTGVLFAIPTELQSSSALPPGSSWHVALHTTDAAALARTLGVSPPSADPTVLDYTLDGYPEIAGSATRTWLEDTFVIDYRDREVAELYAAFAKANAGQPQARQLLVDFVASSMRASFGNPFELASQVAHNRTGDCKAYAVLTAALLRAAGVPARVAVGIVIIERDGRYASFGHAWAEAREAGHWVVADAALKGAPGVVRYLPLGIFNDEGPGFQIAVMRLTPTWIQRVTIVGAP